jgi:hypothetical protein
MAMEKIVWGTGAMGFHPQPLITSFVRDFQIEPDVVERAGIPQLTVESKRKILAENYARMVGLDLDAGVKAIEDDDFAAKRATNGGEPFDLYSTTEAAGHVVA